MNANRISGGLFLLLGIIILAVTSQVDYQPMIGDPGPLLLPYTIGILMTLLAIALAFSPQVSSDENKANTTSDEQKISHIKVLQVLIVGGLLCGYYFSFETVGFTIATAVFCALSIITMGHKSPLAILRALIFSILFSLVVGAAFVHALDVSLPGVLL